MPVSSTATTTGAWFARSQAVWNPDTPRNRASRTLALLPLTGCSHHCCVKNGSLGAACRRCSRRLGSTHSTSDRAISFSLSKAASPRDSGRSNSTSCWSRPTGRNRGSTRPELPDSPASPSTRRQRTDSCAASAVRALPPRGCRWSLATGCFSRTIRPRAGGPSAVSVWACSGKTNSAAASAPASCSARGMGRCCVVMARDEPGIMVAAPLHLPPRRAAVCAAVPRPPAQAGRPTAPRTPRRPRPHPRRPTRQARPARQPPVRRRR